MLRLSIPPSLCLPLPTARPKGDLNEELAPLGVPAGGGQALARRRFGTQRREIPAATQEGGGHAGGWRARRTDLRATRDLANGGPSKVGGEGAPPRARRPSSRCFRVSASASGVRATRLLSAPTDVTNG